MASGTLANSIATAVCKQAQAEGDERPRRSAWRGLLGFGVLVMLSCAVLGQFATAQGSDRSETSRVLQGQVTDRSERPIPEAIVYLKNTKTLAVKTFIADRDGMYRFPALSPNIDYQVHAEHNGKHSNVKTLSAFDSRREAHINLKIDE